MSYVAPKLQHKFETLSIDLKNTILEREVQLYTITDLIHVLEEITKEAEMRTTQVSHSSSGSKLTDTFHSPCM